MTVSEPAKVIRITFPYSPAEHTEAISQSVSGSRLLKWLRICALSFPTLGLVSGLAAVVIGKEPLASVVANLWPFLPLGAFWYWVAPAILSAVYKRQFGREAIREGRDTETVTLSPDGISQEIGDRRQETGDNGRMSASLQCQAILFDLDGVLVDSHTVVERTWRRWIERHGLDVPDIVRRAHGRRSIETVCDVAPQLNADDEVQWLAAVELGDFDGVVALPGAASILEALRKEEWAVVTSGGRELARRRLQHAGLPVPHTLIAAEDVVEGKPAPDGYLMAARLLAFNPAQCIVIEDTPAGIQAGRRLGARTVALTTTFPDLAFTDADVVVHNLSHLNLQRMASAFTLEVK